MRLIDADELCEEFKRRQTAALNWKEQAIMNDDLEIEIRADAVLGFLSEVKLTIDKAPTVEERPTTCPNCDSGYAQGYSDGYLQGKEERPTGEWKLDDTEQFCYCSNCEDTYYPRPLDPSWYFCPHCGAKMLPTLFKNKEVEE